MKKRTLVVIIMVMSLSLIAAGSAFARKGGGYGAKGSGDCYRSDVAPEVMEQFRAETQPLKDELRELRQELRQENRKEDTDAERVAKLREDMDGIRAKIQEIAGKYDIDCDGNGRRGSRGDKGKRNGDCRGDCN